VYYVRTQATGAGGPDVPPASYAPAFYPGTPSAPDAQPVEVAPGQDATGVEISLMPAPAARVSGTVVDLGGRAVQGASVRLVPLFADAAWSDSTDVGWVSTDRLGRFAIGRVPPGEFRLEAQAQGSAGQSEFASRHIVITGDDVPDIVLGTSPGATVAGQIVAASGQRLRALFDRLAVHTRPGTAAESARGAGSRAVPRFGFFELSGLAGARLFRVSGLPADWFLESVLLQGRDITDDPVQFSGAERLTGLRIELTDAPTELSGSVADEAGRPRQDGVVLVFSEDRSRWGFESRFVRLVRVDETGRYLLRGLPAAAYLAVALDDLGNRDQDDPDLLESLRPQAVAVTLRDGESRVLDLRAAPRPSRP
jgi:hypothetical protein